jgi:hypothetical protein
MLIAGAAAGEEPAVERAPVTPYKGMQTREDVFEFTEKPAIEKKDDGYVISFGSKGSCDATVTVVDPKGRVVCHVASGVLGANAPYPFTQDAITQKIDWDGRDDTGKPAPSGCTVKVGLGLKAELERVIAYCPYNYKKKSKYTRHGTFEDGTRCVISTADIRLFDKTGKYIKTLAPHPAATPKARLSAMQGWGKTTDGEELPLPPGRLSLRKAFHGILDAKRGSGGTPTIDPKKKLIVLEGKKGNITIDMEGSFAAEGEPGPVECAQGTGEIRKTAVKEGDEEYGAQPRIAADPVREEIYVHWGGGHVCKAGVRRYDGTTGKVDDKWPDVGAEQTAVGPDGLIYLRTGSYGRRVVKFDHKGTVVPFDKGVTLKKGYYDLPGYLNRYSGDVNGIETGGKNGSNVQQKGFAISPVTGDIYVHMQYISESFASEHEIEVKRGTQLLVVFGPDGGLISPNALPGLPLAHGLGVDRWGNVYKGVRSSYKAKAADGLRPAGRGKPAISFGSVAKFQGGPFPVGPFQKHLWAYPGFSNLGGSACTCSHSMFDTDPYGRTFVPQVHLCSVGVIDGNGNKVLRIGRYGNADDADEKCGKIHVTWPRAVAVSDTAAYILDYGNKRIVKAALSYEAEETVPVP